MCQQKLQNLKLYFCYSLPSHHAFHDSGQVPAEITITVCKEDFQDVMDFADCGAFIKYHIYPKTRKEILCNPSFEKGVGPPSQPCRKLHTFCIGIFPEK
jgi:hypothetical protein